MGRHLREGTGEDQRGAQYTVGYQPDWLRQVKVTRDLPSGRQSTKALFRNPDPPVRHPGPRVRTRLAAPALELEFEIVLDDPGRVVRRIVVETEVTPGNEPERVVFALNGTEVEDG